MPWQWPYWPWVWLWYPVRMQARLTAHEGLVQKACSKTVPSRANAVNARRVDNAIAVAVSNAAPVVGDEE